MERGHDGALITRTDSDVNLNGGRGTFCPPINRNSSNPNNCVMSQEKSPCSCSLGNFMDFRTFSLMFLSRFIIRARLKKKIGKCSNFRENYELLIMARVFEGVPPLHSTPLPCCPCPICKRILA